MNSKQSTVTRTVAVVAGPAESDALYKSSEGVQVQAEVDGLKQCTVAWRLPLFVDAPPVGHAVTANMQTQHGCRYACYRT